MPRASTISTHSHGQPTDPKVLMAKVGDYSQSHPVPMLIKLAPGILKNAHAYDSQGVESRDDAFILYSRFVDLVVNHLSIKPELKQSKMTYKIDPRSTQGQLYRDFARLLPSLPDAMARSEIILGEVKREWDDWSKAEDRKKELRELQRRRMIERKAAIVDEREAHKKLIERRKSSMHSDDYTLSSKLRTLSTGSSTNYSKAYSIDGNIEEELAYPTIDDGDFAIEEDEAGPIKLTSESLPRSTHLKESSNFEINHKTVNKTEGGSPMRTVFLPHELETTFINIANSNTVKNLETCGILCGKLNRNAFFVTHLIIPDQDSTSNTCSTKNEELMFEYIDNEDPDLFILGWIHTHPTQSCFLSSIDLHTQNSYQIMLNEAIAIVCSPSDKFQKQFGIFRLTDPPGVPIITNCNKSGFHPHEEKNLYVECNRLSNKDFQSGHVVVKNKLPFKLKDLRVV